MISPGNYDITCPQGATYDNTFTLTVGGTAQNFTGYTAAMQVRESAGAATALLNLTTSNGGITLGGTAGSVLVTIAGSATSALVAGSYCYDLELYSGSVTTRLLQGSFNLIGEVTRA